MNGKIIYVSRIKYDQKDYEGHLAEEHKRTPISEYLREIVYGGSDGIITTFAVVAGFTGAQSGNSTLVGGSFLTVLLFGFANLLADATSMGLGNFLSIRAEQGLRKSPGEDNPYFTGLATFVAFLFFGLIPLIPYIIFSFVAFDAVFTVSVLFTLLALLLLGFLRWTVTKEGVFRSIGEVVLLGGVSAVIAYFVGTLFAG